MAIPKIHRPGLRIALILGSALVGCVFPYVFLLTLFFAWTLYEEIVNPSPESAPPPPRFRGTPADPEWREYYEALCESVAEEAFLKAMLAAHDLRPGDDALVGNELRLDMQVKVHPYRLDFVANRTYVIEIDGAAWHSSPEAVERDRIRDEYMVAKGYKVLRIPAKVVLNEPHEAVKRVDAYLGRVKPEPVVAPSRPGTSAITRLKWEDVFTRPNALAQVESMNRKNKDSVCTAEKGVALNLDDEVDALMKKWMSKKPNLPHS